MKTVIVIVFPARDPEADQAHSNLQDCGAGCGKTDVEHGYGNLFTHQECNRYPDEKCADDSLNHHKPCHANALEKADKAEQETGQETVNRIGFQVIGRSRDDSRIVRENGGEQIPAPERDSKHNDSQGGRNADCIQQRLLRPLGAAAGGDDHPLYLPDGKRPAL